MMRAVPARLCPMLGDVIMARPRTAFPAAENTRKKNMKPPVSFGGDWCDVADLTMTVDHCKMENLVGWVGRVGKVDDAPMTDIH